MPNGMGPSMHKAAGGVGGVGPPAPTRVRPTLAKQAKRKLPWGIAWRHVHGCQAHHRLSTPVGGVGQVGGAPPCVPYAAPWCVPTILVGAKAAGGPGAQAWLWLGN